MTIDLDELERKARAATPGPWAVETRRLGEGLGFEHFVRQAEASPPYPAHGIATACQWSDDGPDAAFIAAASPDIVLALIARVHSLENALTEALDGWQDALGLAPDDRRTSGERRDEADIARLREIAAGKSPR